VSRPGSLAVAAAVLFHVAAATGVLIAQSNLPGAPRDLQSHVAGNVVTLMFEPPAAGSVPAGYVIEAGSAYGLADLATLDIETTLISVSAPNGTYYVRARARNSSGIGPASNQVVVQVGPGGCVVPSAPRELTAVVSGNAVRFTWQSPASGTVDRFQLAAGSRTSDRSLARVDLGQATHFDAVAPNGTYYAAVVAVSSCGRSPESNEVVIAIGSGGGRRVTPQNPNIPPALLSLLQQFGYGIERGPVRVFSTLGESFSDAHAAHAELTWNYFARVFARSMGARTEIYYTQNQALYRAILAYCPTTFIPGARNVTACWDPVERIYLWVIIPYVIPDYGTQLHELSHSFLYATWLPAETNVWLKEGTGMYYESGSFVGTDLIIERPHPYLTTNFRRWANAGRLLPLGQLVRLTRDGFYTQEPTLVYSQAGMFYFYLVKQHPRTVAALLAGLNDGTLRHNEDVVALITSSTSLSLEALDQLYRNYVLQF
jgi:hypothetical protein